MTDPFLIDLKLVFRADGSADSAAGAGDLETVSGRDNLRQALLLRLLTDRGELGALGHPRYGTRIREFIGEPLDRANLELLRRYVRQALLADPRVASVERVEVRRGGGVSDAVDVEAVVTPVRGEMVELEVSVDVG